MNVRVFIVFACLGAAATTPSACTTPKGRATDNEIDLNLQLKRNAKSIPESELPQIRTMLEEWRGWVSKYYDEAIVISSQPVRDSDGKWEFPVQGAAEGFGPVRILGYIQVDERDCLLIRWDEAVYRLDFYQIGVRRHFRIRPFLMF